MNKSKIGGFLVFLQKVILHEGVGYLSGIRGMNKGNTTLSKLFSSKVKRKEHKFMQIKLRFRKEKNTFLIACNIIFFHKEIK